MKARIYREWIWCVKQIYNFDKKYILLSLIESTVNGILPPLMLILIQQIVNSLQINTARDTTIKILFIYLIIEFINTTFTNLYSYYKRKFLLDFNLVINKRILKKASKFSLKDYENSEIYDVINRAQSESEGKIVEYFDIVLGIFSLLISLLTYFTILIKLKVWLVLIVISIPILKFFISKKIDVESFSIVNERTNDSRKTWYIKDIITYGNYIKELKINNLFGFFIDKYVSYQIGFNEEDILLERKRSFFMIILSILESLIDGIVLIYIILLGFKSLIMIGNVMTYLNTISQIKKNLSSILSIVSGLSRESLFMGQLVHFFKMNTTNETKEEFKVNNIESIKISGLCYKYEGSSRYVLKDINFEIRKGENVVIVGENGCGKTTLIKILLGLYDDYDGHVYINGIDYKQIDKEDVFNRFSVLFQDFIQYEGTYRENIGYSNLSQLKNDKNLIEISSKFDIDNLIKSSNRFLDTQIGHLFDNGKQISAGQWQKIGLSRAFFKDADVFVLDEPNSALDTISEKKFISSYTKMIEKKIGIIIAHRFSGFIQEATRIILISEGRVKSMGSHEELMTFSEDYKNLYDMQT